MSFVEVSPDTDVSESTSNGKPKSNTKRVKDRRGLFLNCFAKRDNFAVLLGPSRSEFTWNYRRLISRFCLGFLFPITVEAVRGDLPYSCMLLGGCVVRAGPVEVMPINPFISCLGIVRDFTQWSDYRCTRRVWARYAQQWATYHEGLLLQLSGTRTPRVFFDTC